MKKLLLVLLIVVGTGCVTAPVEMGMHEIRYNDDAPVVLSDLVEAVTPVDMPDAQLRALILPFALRQDIAVRKDVGREMADIFRLAWLERQVFPVLEFDSVEAWPGLDRALALARAKGANILVSGNLSQFYEGSRSSRTSVGLTVEVHWVPDGSLLWSAAQAAAMEGAPDKDFALVRSVRRLPEHPTYAVMRGLAGSMADGFARHLRRP